MTTTTPEGVRIPAKTGVAEEIHMIPVWAYVSAALVFVLVPILFFGFVWSRGIEGPTLFQLFITFFPGTMLAFLTLMVGYVNRDAGRRGMSRTLWTLIVIFVPNAIGFILYFLMRTPIRTQCPKCNTTVAIRDNYCPACGYSFHPTCPHCRSSIRPADTFCSNCGMKLNNS
jgi:hypothetical protein